MFKGITGMESWFWLEGSTEISWTQRGRPGITAACDTVPGPSRRFTARVDRYRWTLGDGTTITSRHAGTPSNPAAEHVYETKSDDYVVKVERVWVGDPAGEFTDTGAQLAYPVMEVRSVLVGTDSDP